MLFFFLMNVHVFHLNALRESVVSLGLQELLIQSGLLFVNLTTWYCLCLSKLFKSRINIELIITIFFKLDHEIQSGD